jgi:hypothetical protein
MATTKNIFVVINHIAITITIGKLKNIIKLNITLIFKNNIRKYNFIVLFKFRIVILDEVQIASKTHLLSIIITYFEYVSNIFNNIHRNNKTKNI